MNYKTIPIYFIILLLLSGCFPKNIFYIDNDNYLQYYQNYVDDIKVLNSRKYKLIAAFNDQPSFDVAKSRINLIKRDQLNKVDIYAIIIYSYDFSKELKPNDALNNVSELYDFLKIKKQYKNNLYIIGVPQKEIKYEVLVYFKNVSNKE